MSAASVSATTSEFVTARVDGLLVGVPIGVVRDVFTAEAVTPVPLAPPFVTGIINLRGRIVTLIDLRRRIGLPRRPQGSKISAIGFDVGRECYGIVVDMIGEVMKLDDGKREAFAVGRSGELADVSAGIYRLDGGLMAVLDVQRLLGVVADAKAA